MQQIAVGRVQLNYLKARRECPLSGGAEIGDDLLNAGRVEGGGHRVFIVEGGIAGADYRPATFAFGHHALARPRAVGAGFAAGVGQLNAGHAALRRDEGVDALEHGHLLIFPDAEVFGTDAALGRHGRGLLNNETGPAHGPAAQVHEVPVIGKAVLGAVLAHG